MLDRLTLGQEQQKVHNALSFLRLILTARNEVAARLCFHRASVILFTGGGHAWQGACMVGGIWGACMPGGVHGGHVWWGVFVAGGDAWQGEHAW